MKVPSPRSNKKARIEIIPLIDIIFFLLATFVMVSLSMVKNQGIPVNLPVASTGAAQERQNYASITITENGEIHFNQEKVTLDQLNERLRQLKIDQPDPRIFINGDEKASFGKAVSLLDEVRRHGITRVAIETRPRPAAGGSLE
jgi:biopolymer transport protein ExbD